MPLLRSAAGLILPMTSRAGAPLLNSPSSVPAPPIITPPSELLFDMTTARLGVPGVNDQFEYLGTPRDWPNNFTHPSEGFAGIRWQPTWIRAEGFYGSWEPATSQIYRVQRKGTSGQALQTLVITGGPNTASIPVGDKVVFWESTGDGNVSGSTSFNLSGYNLPLKAKLTVTASTPSAAGDVNGRRIIEVATGTDLPAIDFYPTIAAGSYYDYSNLQLRHWSFYKDAATKSLRHPLGWFTGISKDDILANGGYVVLGGMQFIPSYLDWTSEYNAFGASLTEELWQQECEGLAEYFGNTDPRRCAVELENEPTSDYVGSGGDFGYGDLLPDVWYGIARQVWGPERTIMVKSTNYGSLNSLLDEFTFVNPTGDNTHLVIHNYDGQIVWPNGVMNFGNITMTDWLADQLATKIAAMGYKGGGMTEVGAAPYEFWDSNLVVSEEERGRRMGRVLTSLTAQDLYMFVWGNSGDHYRNVDVRSIDGKNIEAYYATMSPYARRSGLTVA